MDEKIYQADVLTRAWICRLAVNARNDEEGLAKLRAAAGQNMIVPDSIRRDGKRMRSTVQAGRTTTETNGQRRRTD